MSSLIIAGLGNPGKEYEKTRHNVGFHVVDLLAEDASWNVSKKARAQYCKKEIAKQTFELLKPATFMNNSGFAVSHAAKKHGLPPEKIFVVHDDLDLPLGTVRISRNASSAGHNGVQSVIDHLGTKDFVRFRIGIRPAHPIANPEKFVLTPFAKDERAEIEKAVHSCAAAVQYALERGMEAAMNKYN